MSKSILMSIRPKWSELIASGKKTIEIRKTKPKLETPFKVYIYQTKQSWIYSIYSRIAEWQGKVIGEFLCANIDNHTLINLIVEEDAIDTLTGSCLTKDEVLNYLGYKKGTNIYHSKHYDFYGWHISDLKIYDRPKKLSEFGLERPPQSWCYVEEQERNKSNG